MNYVGVLIVGVIAGTISGVVGTGSSIMLLPVLAVTFGAKQAVPIMAVAAVLANVSRVVAWWREVDWRAFAAYAIAGVPAAVLGARTMLALPAQAVDLAIGFFLIAMIPFRHFLATRHLRLSLVHMALAGAAVGYLTGIVVSTGPLSVPIFLAYGLTKGAFLATEAASSLAIYLAKTITFQQSGALPLDIVLNGLIAGSSVMAGTFVAKGIVERLRPEMFRWIMDGLILVCGLTMIWNGMFAES